MDKWSLFFGWVGVVALLLVVPLNILSNTLTPKVHNWWATSSRARAVKRIEWIDQQFLGCDLIEQNFTLVIVDVAKNVVLGLACAVIGIGLQVTSQAAMSLSAMERIANNGYLPAAPLEGYQVFSAALGIELFAVVLWLKAWRRLTLVSPENVRLLRARLSAERIKLRRKFNLVDNSEPKP